MMESKMAKSKVKTCTGCLYYASRFNADSRDPICLGRTRSPPNVSEYDVRATDVTQELYKKDKFLYYCVGHSHYVKGGKRMVSPHCKGLEIGVEITPPHSAAAATATATATDAESPPVTHNHNKQPADGNGLPQRQSPRPTNSKGDEFLSRFARNANLVANGVAKNVRRVGNQIKHVLNDALQDQYRKRPK